jgi:hypothetical protein
MINSFLPVNMAKWCKSLCLVLVLALSLSSLPWVGFTHAQSNKPSPPVFNTRVVYNLSIEFNITNQPFTNSSTVNAISYIVRAINPNTGFSLQYPNNDFQSNGSHTILTMPMSMLSLTMPNASSVDFQMQAQTGYYSRIYKQGQMPEATFATEGYWEDNFNPAEKSDWSQTQTVDLTAGASSTPTTPEFSWLMILPLFLSLLSIVFLFRKRKFGDGYD